MQLVAVVARVVTALVACGFEVDDVSCLHPVAGSLVLWILYR